VRPEDGVFTTSRGVEVSYEVCGVEDAEGEITKMVNLLDDQKGVLLTSSYEFPGRYARWSVGFVAPALQIEGRGLDFSITALNERGVILSDILRTHLAESSDFVLSPPSSSSSSNNVLKGRVLPSEGKYFAEEERSKQPSLFSLIRTIREVFFSPNAGQLGLYGSLGYDLTFQFEPIELSKKRDADQRDLVMYLPDEILVIDNQKNDAWKIRYEFSFMSASTKNKARVPSVSEYVAAESNLKFEERDSARGMYAKSVVRAKEEFRVGNLFEVVLSQAFREKLNAKPSTIFKRLCKRNPSPYGFFMNLGQDEYLIGASPEMFVRVENTAKGLRVETCPISGTIERGGDPLEDAQQIKKLLLNAKEESELTMCTDVDRNDKSRICEPGSVRVLGRRQIEMYSRLIHTVDHVEGYLRAGFDALDAFLCHTWAVTVTGAPKTWAIRFIENMEPGVRHWYGGAVGMVGFDGTLNTGLTLRTIRVKKGIAEVRAGATLLHDSDPAAEEAETELKASALIDAIVRSDDKIDNVPAVMANWASEGSNSDKRPQVLLVDHEDSFVHTLANYLRQTGADVVTCRSGAIFDKFLSEQVDTGKFKPDLVVLSPGPGSPSTFQLSHTIDCMIARKVPIFGVCLGLQGLVEHFGGELGILDYPMHGKPSSITRSFSDEGEHKLKIDVLRGLPAEFTVARYHSLYGNRKLMPKELIITASTADGVVMAIQHAHMPIAAVQFHPESILTLPKNGMKILTNALKTLQSSDYA